MSITLVGTEGYFNRQGAFAGEFNRTAALYGSSVTDPAFNSIWLQFASSDRAAVTTLPDAVATFRQTNATYTGVLTQEAQAASILQADRNIPLVPANSFPASVAQVRDQMVTTGQYINRPTLTTSIATDVDNRGNTKVFVSTTNIYGDPLDMTVAENVTVTVTSQGTGFSGSASAIGQPTVTPNSWNWPQGSGASASVTIVDPAIAGIISNSALSTFTVANTPDSWTIISGAAGSTVFKGTSGGARGSDCVYLQSDGSQATKLAQSMSLQVNTVYAVTFQAKMNANSASGTLVVQIYDNTNSAVMTNDAGTSLQASYALNGGAGEITTSYQLLTVFFSTPRQLPASVQLRIGYGTAGVSTRQLFLCNVQVFAATGLYGRQNSGTFGPFIAMVANTTASAVGDIYTATFTNSLTTQSFVWGLQRLHDFRGNGLYYPSSSTPTISDSLVTH